MDAIRKAVIELSVDQKPLKVKAPSTTIITKWKNAAIKAHKAVEKAAVKSERSIQRELAKTAKALEKVIALEEARAAVVGGGARRAGKRPSRKRRSGRSAALAAGLSGFGDIGFGGSFDPLSLPGELRDLGGGVKTAYQAARRAAVRRFGAAGVRGAIGSAARVAGPAAVAYAGLRGAQYYYDRQNRLALEEGQRINARRSAQFSARVVRGLESASLLSRRSAQFGSALESTLLESAPGVRREMLDRMRFRVNVGPSLNTVAAMGVSDPSAAMSANAALRGRLGDLLSLNRQRLSASQQEYAARLADEDRVIGSVRALRSRRTAALGGLSQALGAQLAAGRSQDAAGASLLGLDPFVQGQLLSAGKGGIKNLTDAQLLQFASLAQNEKQAGVLVGEVGARARKSPLNRMLEQLTGVRSDAVFRERGAGVAEAERAVRDARRDELEGLRRANIQSAAKLTGVTDSDEALRLLAESREEVAREGRRVADAIIAELKRVVEQLGQVRDQQFDFEKRQEQLERAGRTVRGS